VPAAAPGELFELRVARLLHAEGAFVRRRVNLDQQVGGRLQVTDLDVLAFDFDDTLRLRVETGECKTAEAKNAPSTKDRLLWLVGVNRLVGAENGFLATTKTARDPDRHFARSIDLDLVDVRDLERREAILDLRPDGGVAAHSLDALAFERQVEAATKKDEELRRVYWFVRGDMWLGEPVPALKRALGAMRVLGQRWSPELPVPEQRVLRWLASEAIIGFVVAVTRLAGESYRAPEQVFAQHLNERLAEGLASFDAMREIAKQVDKFLVGVLREAGVGDSHVVGAIGALAPRPPSYAEPLLELIQRLAAEPRLARRLPQLAEAYLALELYGGDLGDVEADGARLLRLLAAFIQRQGRLPDELTLPLRRRPGGGHRATAELPAPEVTATTEETAGAVGDGSDDPEQRLFGDVSTSTGNRPSGN
jgi:hypothetical protein